MDAALLNLIITVAALVATFLFRKRILAALGRLLFDGAIEFARGTFLVEEEVEGPDGSKVARIGLSVRGRALLAAVVPPLIAEVARTVKLKLPSGPGLAIPAGASLEEMAPIALQMLPKRYQGIAALALPFLQQFMGGQPGGGSGSAKQESLPGHLKHVSKP